MNNKHDLWYDHPLFSELSTEWICAVSELCREECFYPGHTLFEDREPATNMYLLVVNSSHIAVETDHIDIDAAYVQANRIADEWGTTKMLNMAALGAMLANRADILSLEVIEQALSDHLPATKAHLVDSNRQVLQQSYQAVSLERSSSAIEISLNKM